MAQRICSIEACPGAIWARGWCRIHYSRWYDHGDPLAAATRVSSYRGAACKVDDCAVPARVRGWCKAHYQAWLKRGDPLGSAPKRPVRLCDYPDCENKHKTGGYCEQHARQVRGGRPVGPILPNGERRRIYSLDHSYFDEISDERRAYWLGFITADGCVRHVDGRSILSVALKVGDSGHLRSLCDDLGSDRPILFSKRSEAAVHFNSEPIAAALGRLGVGPRKTATVLPWNGPADLMPHYWRGLFDGDGCLHRQSRTRKWTLNVVGSEACVAAFAGWAREVTGSRAAVRPLAGCHGWAVGGTLKPQLLAEALYVNAEIALPRKQVLADELLALDFGRPAT
jgi:hypothetical protein